MKVNVGYNLKSDFSGGVHHVGSALSIIGQLLQTWFFKRHNIYLGEVVGIQAGQVTVRLWSNGNLTKTRRFKTAEIPQSPIHHQESLRSLAHPPIKSGDRVLFDDGYCKRRHAGQPVYRVKYNRLSIALTFQQGDFDLKGVQVGDLVWKV